ncbi:MAG: leucine-rich repeat domain-containing protein [bacterium]
MTIPESVTLIGDYAFTGCSKLSTLNFNAINCSDFNFGSYSGFRDSPLTTVTIGDNVNYISSYFLYGQTGLNSVIIPESVTSIGNYAFYNCSGITSISMPDAVTSIGDYTFYNCLGIKTITIPEDVTTIGDNAFSGCTGLSRLIFNAKSCDDFSSVSGFVDSPLTSATVGDNVTYIPAYFMYGQSKIDYITMPEGLTEIGTYAFYGCTALDEFTFPSTMQKIGNRAFSLCSAITEMTVDASVPPTIESKTFNGVDRSIPVYVAANYADAYRSHEYWKEFNIQGVGNITTSTETVKSDEIDFIQNGNTISFTEEQQVSVYSINGVCVFSGITRDLQLTTRGIYIVVTSSGTTKVII